jgi:hypothetical protein
VVAAAAVDPGAGPSAPTSVARARKKLSGAAEALLKEAWGAGGDDEAEEEGKGGCRDASAATGREKCKLAALLRLG